VTTDRRPPAARHRQVRGETVDEHGVIVTAHAVEQRIAWLSRVIEDMAKEIELKAQAAAEAEAAYKVRFAQQRLVARDQEGHGPGGRTSNDEADDRATRDCAKELRAYLIADALYESAKQALKSRTSQMDALRTIAANIRAATT
jgi:hypothetical protein